MKKKIVALCLIIALAATAVIGGTLAYFSDETEVVNNTFTVGQVGLSIAEDVTAVPDKGYLAGTAIDGGAKYDIMPGNKYAKNVSITMDDNSQEAYVFVELTVSPIDALWAVMDYDQDMLEQLLVGENATIFAGTHLEDNLVAHKQEGTAYTEVYFCKKAVAEEVINLFEAVEIPATIDDQDFPEISFDIKAYAVQALGIATVKDAYDALGFEGYTWVG